MTRYAARLGARRALVMYFDTFLQGPAPLHVPAPCPVSGIYFRPTAHYRSFPGASLGPHDRLRAARQQLALRLAGAHRQVDTVFSLDPLAVPTLPAGLHPQPLADPVAPGPLVEPTTTRARLGLDPGEPMALLFGHLTERKGVVQAVEAVRSLPSSVRIRLVLAGTADSATTEALHALRVDQERRVLWLDRFVDDDEVQPLFQAADVVLAPYDRHVGSSGILIRAAAAERPVIASGYGLMGEWVRRHGLGLALPELSSSAIRAGLEAFLAGDVPADPARMAAFAAQNTPARFADTLIAHILDG